MNNDKRLSILVESKDSAFSAAIEREIQGIAQRQGCSIGTRQTSVGMEYTLVKQYKTREEEWA